MTWTSGMRAWGRFCTGCAEGKMVEHARVASTKAEAFEPGEAIVADLMFVDLNHEKIPLMCCVDEGSKCIVTVELKDKKVETMERAFESVLDQFSIAGHHPKRLIFDRETAIVAMESWIATHSIRLNLKAAAQKVGLAEVTIRQIREVARATKAGVRAEFGYIPPDAFNIDLCKYAAIVLNRGVRLGYTVSPYELFTGMKLDVMRDLRVAWGEVVVVKKPKGISSDLRVTGQWAVVVFSYFNRSGVIKVYLVESGKYAHRFVLGYLSG